MAMKEPEQDEALALMKSLVGRTITRADWFDSSPDQDWTGHEEGRLWLNDGRVIEFSAWGHDAWGATVQEIEVMDIEKCLHCGQAHKDRIITGPWEWSSDHLPHDSRFAWCVDGNHAAWIEGEVAGWRI